MLVSQGAVAYTRHLWHLLPQVGIGAGMVFGGDLAIMPRPAVGQIAGDGSLGSLINGSATGRCLAATCTITGGSLNAAGSTLLHSFGQFSLEDAGQSALFVDPGVNDIVVRVTGGLASLLNGEIQASAGSRANLFFVNPSGIRFGPTAQLSLGGAFIASTAHQIAFGHGVMLLSGSATPLGGELLTISAPVGLGFLASETSASITVQGTGHLLAFGAPDLPSAFVNRIFQQGPPPGAGPPGGLLPLSDLAVRPGAAIALVANGIDLAGGNLSAVGGQIELGSVSAGTVLFNPDLSLDYGDVDAFADISLSDRATLEVSDRTPGRVLLGGRDIFGDG
ncbi:MAG: filamentous hemagglutinin N-terminal domain-containing protein [Phormidesmis sp. RL_2_1]|nr:filamentous hemagglutinin N-terminal domain-containing protein [Phormidesmis sp. RL_2_1]